MLQEALIVFHINLAPPAAESRTVGYDLLLFHIYLFINFILNRFLPD